MGSQSAARTNRPSKTGDSHTGGLSGIFSDVHAAGENNLTFFAACGRRTLRGFLYTKPGAFSLGQLVKKVPLGFFAKLLSELQNQFLYHDFAILPLRRVIERERTP